MKYKSLYIIPARGGSKGIPRKNIKLLGGTPLIHYSINVARELANDDSIIVSTDDEEIAEVARQTGLAVPYMRPAYLASDTAGSREVILDAMDYADAQGIKYDNVVLLQPTSPLRKSEDVKACLELYSPQIDMVVSVVETATNPYYNCFETDVQTGYLHVCKGDGKITRRQDAPRVWEYNGAVYVINPRSIRAMAMGEFSSKVPCEMPRERSIDLDTPMDWAIAELVISELSKNK